MSEKNLKIINSIKIYFPYLINEEITTIDLLKENKENLLQKSQKLINKDFERNIENVALFYNIYEKRKLEHDYINEGINKSESPLQTKQFPSQLIYSQIKHEY